VNEPALASHELTRGIADPAVILRSISHAASAVDDESMRDRWRRLAQKVVTHPLLAASFANPPTSFNQHRECPQDDSRFGYPTTIHLSELSRRDSRTMSANTPGADASIL
jgi:hypothetical protein